MEWPRRVAAGCVGIAATLGVGLVGCTGSEEGGEDPAVERTAPAPLPELPPFPDGMLASTWVVQFARVESLGPVSGEGWVALVTERNLRRAVENSQGDPALAARAHVEAAVLFEQAALIASHAFVEVYEKTPEPTDPAGVAHLLTVAHAVLGHPDEARAWSAKLPAGDPTEPWHGPWKAWLAGDATWPPPLGQLPLELGKPAMGVWPELPPPPHYELPETGTDSKRTMGDPGALVALSLWHRAAAAQAGEAHVVAASASRVGFGLPGAPQPAAPGDLTALQTFGSTLLGPSDADFLVALHGEQGMAAVEAFADRSLVAWLARESRSDGRFDADKASRLVAALREGLLEACRASNEGTLQGHMRMFADLGAAAALWSLALVAEVEGDRDFSGLMRLHARDRADLGNHLKDPVSLLSLAAWDAGNRNVHRAPELLHNQTGRYPDLEVARYGLDVLALRVQKERIENSGM